MTAVAGAVNARRSRASAAGQGEFPDEVDQAASQSVQYSVGAGERPGWAGDGTAR
jgi:hypothetical protein